MVKSNYFINFNVCDNDLSSYIKISKKVFDEQIKILNNKIDEYKEIIEHSVTLDILNNKTKYYDETIYYYYFDCSLVTLVKRICNDNYRFKK